MSGGLSVPTIEALMGRASERTGGLSDFGAPAFRDGLGRLLQSLREEQHRFTQEGVDALAAQWVDRLGARLMVEDWYASHPEVEAVQPERPVLITGLPRTGTTALAKVLSYEPSFRLLRAWEQHPPVPPPTLETEQNDPRRLAWKARFEKIAADPQSRAMHLHELDTAEEDVSLIWMAFKAQGFTAPTFGYHAWWRDSDMKPAYAYQRRIIKLLQSRRGPSTWLFKAPHYAFHLEDLSAAYPDGVFLITHRDPVKVLASYASFVTRLWPPGSRERTDMAEFAPHLTHHMAIGMQRMIEARARLGEHRFFDIRHQDFVADPVGVLRRAYDFMRLPFTPEVEAQMAGWADRNRPGAHGEHKYKADDFGLKPDEIREQFAFYTDKYKVQLERI